MICSVDVHISLGAGYCHLFRPYTFASMITVHITPKVVVGSSTKAVPIQR